MNITTLQFFRTDTQTQEAWRFKSGVGRLRNLTVLIAQSEQLSMIAKAVAFIFKGLRSDAIQEAQVEITDNAGDVWKIARDEFGCRFALNGVEVSIERAQRSMIAALLDLEVGISTSQAISTPLVSRSFHFVQGSFVSRDALTPTFSSPENTSKEIRDLIASECAKLMGIETSIASEKILSIALPLLKLQSRWLDMPSMPQVAKSSAAPALGMIETLTRELDHLLQIDFLTRKISDSKDQIPKLKVQIEVVQQRLQALQERCLPAYIELASNLDEWGRGLVLMCKSKGYASLAEVSAKVKRLSSEKVRPAAEAALQAWDDFFGSSKITGQEVESCLASMLLGMKQLSQDLERIQQHIAIDQGERPQGVSSGWFERLKDTIQKIPSDQKAIEFDSLKLHTQWLAKASRDVDNIRESIEYALRSVQTFVDETNDSKEAAARGLETIGELSDKAQAEFARLVDDWRKWTTSTSLSPDISFEDYVELPATATEMQYLEQDYARLSQHLTERQALECSLEALVRQWWSLIGSDKAIDLSHTSLLISEANAALRHRDARRQRIHKLIKESARFAKDEVVCQWTYKRKTDLMSEWNELFGSVGLIPIDITDKRVEGLARLSLALVGQTQLEQIYQDSLKKSGDLWSSREAAAVRLYLWADDDVDQEKREAFTQVLKTYPLEGESTVSLLLLTDQTLADALMNYGYGRASHASSVVNRVPTNPQKSLHDDIKSHISKPLTRSTATQQGASVADESTRSAARQVGPSAKTTQEMSSKAMAALKILNPRLDRK
jgi:hypothetical protein